MPRHEPSVFLIGYGNPARGDDGLGPACAEAIEALGLAGVTVQTNYQLQVEDATIIANRDVVIFIDADADPAATGAYTFTRVEPEADGTVTTHHVSAGTLLALAHDLFGATAQGYMLGIRGVDFAPFTEHLSDEASANLEAAQSFLESALRHRQQVPLDTLIDSPQPCEG